MILRTVTFFFETRVIAKYYLFKESYMHACIMLIQSTSMPQNLKSDTGVHIMEGWRRMIEVDDRFQSCVILIEYTCFSF